MSARIVAELGADARLRAALSKLGWNREPDRTRLLRIIIKKVEVAQGVVRVQLDPAAALAEEQAHGLRPEPKTIAIPYGVVNDTRGVQTVPGREAAASSPRPNPALIHGVVRGYRWRSQLLSGEARQHRRAGPQGGS